MALREIEEEIVITRKTNGLWSYTASTLMGEMLVRAEELYGVRDETERILGVHFAESGVPITLHGPIKGRQSVCVCLGQNAFRDSRQAWFELSQEIVHLLSHSEPITVFEEGLATHFAILVLAERGLENKGFDGNYSKACDLVRELLAIDPNAVKKLRTDQPIISRITAGEIEARYPAFGHDKALTLEKDFYSIW